MKQQGSLLSFFNKEPKKQVISVEMRELLSKQSELETSEDFLLSATIAKKVEPKRTV